MTASAFWATCGDLCYTLIVLCGRLCTELSYNANILGERLPYPEIMLSTVSRYYPHLQYDELLSCFRTIFWSFLLEGSDPE